MTDVLAEHICYLTLPGRNDLFRRAISAKVKDGDLIADLGCGVGVLGIFCLEQGAHHCWGIDSSAAIHLARESMDRAGLADRYTAIPGSTFRTDLPQPVDVIICDHVGFMGFDYGIIRLMRDARRRFLKPGGAMIPQALDLMVAPVSSDTCRATALKWVGERVPEAYHWVDALAHNRRYSHNFVPSELIGHGAHIGHIDFAADEPGFFRFEASLRIARAGRFDGFAGWFDCLLAEGVRMTNSPLDPASIQRAQAFFPARESFAVDVGDEVRITLRFRADDDVISWTIAPPGGSAVHRLSTFNATILAPADLVRDQGRALALNPVGEARAFVLSQVDGVRSGEAIIASVLAERPDLLPTEQAIRDFVTAVLAQDCST